MRKGYFIRFSIYITAVLLLAAYACDGGTGPGDGALSGFLYLFLEFTDDSCVQKLSGDDGSQVFDIDLDAGWRMYDIAVNPDNGDFYVYYGMDVNHYSKDGELLKVFDEVTMNTPWEKLECALTGDNRLLWIIDVDYNLICFDALTGEHVADGPEGFDVQTAPGNTVWAYSRINETDAIRRIKPDGTSQYRINKNGSNILRFAINPSDYSIWVRYDDNTFVHYDSTGNEIGSFEYDFPGSSDYGISFCVSGVNDDLLVAFAGYYVFSENGELRYSKDYDYPKGFCYASDFNNWFGVVWDEDIGYKVVNYRSSDGGLVWEVNVNNETEYLERAPK
jgi:hypothetical protein